MTHTVCSSYKDCSQAMAHAHALTLTLTALFALTAHACQQAVPLMHPQDAIRTIAAAGQLSMQWPGDWPYCTKRLQCRARVGAMLAIASAEASTLS